MIMICLGLLTLLLVVVSIKLLIQLNKTGHFGLVIEIDIKKREMYGWYKGILLGIKIINLSNTVDEILLTKQSFYEECKIKVNKIKLLNSKL